MAKHELKVQPPYFDALLDGSKTFEVRRNDRGFQRGDVLLLREFDAIRQVFSGRAVSRPVSFVYSGDPRFGGIEPGYVVLGLAETGEPQ